MKDMNFSYEPQPIMTINNQIKKKLIDLTPTFQRGYIWKREFKDELIVSILSGYPIGNVIIYKKNGSMEVVDGQQRLTTINHFIGDKFDFYEVRTRKSVNRIKEIIKDYYDKYQKILSEDDIRGFNKLLGSGSIKFDDFPDLVKDDFMSYNLNVTYLTSIHSEAIAEYFKYVQNQETLKAGEIINSMYIYNVQLNDLTSKIDDKANLIRSLGFNSKRYEFDKHFVNYVGLLIKKIPLNTTQSAIVNFAKDFKIIDVNENVHLLIDNLNLLTNYCIENDYKLSLNARMLKVLLAYLSFYHLKEHVIDNLDKIIKEIDIMHKKNVDEITQNITFIEKSTKSYDDIKNSAKNFHIRLSKYV